MFVGATIGGTLLGFLAGLFTCKVKSGWCPECGASIRQGERHAGER
jgi:hypothetical protein